MKGKKEVQEASSGDKKRSQSSGQKSWTGKQELPFSFLRRKVNTSR